MAAVSAEGLSVKGGWAATARGGLVCDPAKARGTLLSRALPLAALPAGLGHRRTT